MTAGQKAACKEQMPSNFTFDFVHQAGKSQNCFSTVKPMSGICQFASRADGSSINYFIQADSRHLMSLEVLLSKMTSVI